jgi:hypothetical protein
MDERDELLNDMWKNWKPYNKADNDKWRSYVVSQNEASLLETEADCITIVQGADGLYVQ